MSPVNHAPAAVRRHTPGAQTQRNARLLASPIVRTRIIECARHHKAAGTPIELSAAIVADLRRDWPGLDEAAVDSILVSELFARQAEAETYRSAMQSAMSTGRQAAEDVRAEGVSDARDGWGRPVQSAGRVVPMQPGACA